MSYTQEQMDVLSQKIPQQKYPKDIDIKELPGVILRKCCPGKTCCNVDLWLDASAKENLRTGQKTITYAYRRDSNDEIYFLAATLEGLVELINDESYWPDQWEQRKSLFPES